MASGHWAGVKISPTERPPPATLFSHSLSMTAFQDESIARTSSTRSSISPVPATVRTRVFAPCAASILLAVILKAVGKRVASLSREIISRAQRFTALAFRASASSPRSVGSRDRLLTWPRACCLQSPDAPAASFDGLLAPLGPASLFDARLRVSDAPQAIDSQSAPRDGGATFFRAPPSPGQVQGALIASPRPGSTSSATI